MKLKLCTFAELRSFLIHRRVSLRLSRPDLSLQMCKPISGLDNYKYNVTRYMR